MGWQERPLPDAVSPNGVYRLRVIPPAENEPENGNAAFLVLEDVASGRQASRTDLGNYGAYPTCLAPKDFSFLWSPDSNRLAVMVRDGKHSWTTNLYSIEAGVFTATELSAASGKALSAAGLTSGEGTNRVVPVRWQDGDHLLLKVSGDAKKANQSVWYEADVTYSAKEQKLSQGKVISITPHES